MNIAQLARRHPAMSITLALVWAASWVPIFVLWTTGIEVWMIGVRYAVLVLVAALVALGARAAGEPAYERSALRTTIVVAVVDVIVLFLPDLFTGIADGSPWWGFVEAGVFALLLGAIWVLVGGVTAGILGARLGPALGLKAHQRVHPRS